MGGRVVFFGDVDDGARELIDHFEAVPSAPRLPKNTNPADWMLDVIGAGIMRHVDADFCAHYESSELRKRVVYLSLFLCTGMCACAGGAPPEAAVQSGPRRVVFKIGFSIDHRPGAVADEKVRHDLLALS